MRIDKIHINDFGKLRNFNLELGNGLNTIFGNNEDGKTTIMAFMKMAFYGTEGKSNDLQKNLRKKYFPWSGNSASGSIEFFYNNQKYRLDKLFGATNSSDKTEIINLSTSEKFLLGNKTAGETFFGFSLATFEKSVFISQPGAFSDNKIDEINFRLSNMITSADESVSFDKVAAELDSKIYSLKSKSGKIGTIDILNQKIYELNETLSQAHQIKSQKQELSESIAIKEQEILRLETALNEKSKQLENFDTIKKYNTLAAIKRLSDEVDELKNTIAEQKVFLTKGDIVVNNEFLEKSETLLSQCENLKKQQVDIENRLSILTGDIDLPKNFPNDEEIIIIQEKDKKVRSLKQEVDVIEQKIQTIGRSDLGISEDKIRFAKENYNRVNRQMESEIQRFESLYSMQKKPKNNFKFFTLFLGIALCAISLYLGITQNPLFHYGLVLGFAVILLPILLYILKGNPQKQTKEQQIAAIKSHYKADLDQAKSEHSQSELDYQNLIAEQKQRQMNLDNERKNLLENYNSENKELSDLIKKFECESAEQLLNIYVKSQSKINTEKGARAELEQSLLNTQNQLKVTFDNLVSLINLFTSSMELSKIRSLLNELKQTFQSFSMNSSELNTKNDLLQKSLKGNSIDKIKAAETAYREQLGNKAFSYDEPDDEFESNLKIEISRLRTLFEKEKSAHVKMSADLSARFKNTPSVANVQSEIKLTTDKIKELNNIYKALTIARETLEDSHNEMRQNYTPILNDGAARILSKLTNGKYRDIKVTKTLDINIEDNLTGFFREWQYLSTGTIDQAYLAVQLTLASIFTDNDCVQILDDSFAHYDDKRTELAFDFLREYANQRQVILFTCRGREAELGERFGTLHDIR